MTDPDPTASPPIAEGLNEPQAEAVAHVDGPLIVFAGAGSGKTRVITYRIANLVATHHVPPYRVLAVTFTNKAAGEMRSRLERVLGAALTRDLWVGTFHAVCVRLLRRCHDEAGLARDFVIYDTTDQRAVVSRAMRDLSIDEKRYPPQKVLARICREKQEARGPHDMARNSYGDEVVQRCFVEYAKRMRASNAVDFEDLLLAVLRLAEEPKSPAGEELRNRFSHVLVDEFQDVNQVQYRLIRALGGRRNICVVGDDDQSIYQWRGADVRNIRNFTKDFPDAKLVKLEQNYRSSARIVRAALGIIKPSTERVPKELWTANADGRPVTVVHAQTERDEAAWVVSKLKRLLDTGTSPREVAVFYRVHAQSRVLEEVMRRANVPYQIVGGFKFFERAEVKDLLSYLRVLVNPRSEVDVLRVINNPPRKIGAKTIEELHAVAQAEACSLLEAIEPLCRTDRVNAGTKQRLRAFEELIRELARRAETASPAELATEVLERTGYAAALEAEDSAESDARLDNLRELRGSIDEYEEERAEAGEPASLSDYLARVSLTADADTLADVPRVPMMTVHAAKGLEFEVVFLTGMEERLFPLRGVESEEPAEMEEERRLAYVATTRARRELYASHAQVRTIYGQMRYNEPSRFLGDMPQPDVQVVLTESMREAAHLTGRDPEREAPARQWREPRAAAPTDAAPTAPVALPVRIASPVTGPADAWADALSKARAAWGDSTRSPEPARDARARPDDADARAERGEDLDWDGRRKVWAERPERGGFARSRSGSEHGRRERGARAAATGAGRSAPTALVRAPERRPGERYLERDPEASHGPGAADGPSTSGLAIGAKVRHAKFGIGVVKDLDEGPDPTVTVQFPGWPLKRIKLAFLLPP